MCDAMILSSLFLSFPPLMPIAFTRKQEALKGIISKEQRTSLKGRSLAKPGMIEHQN